MIYEYFAAPDDRAAASAYEGGPEAAGLPWFWVKGVDPAVDLAPLVALVDGALDGEVRLVSDPESDWCWVMALPDGLGVALAAAGAGRRAEAAAAWARVLGGRGELSGLPGFLERLAGLGRLAGWQLYCRVVL
ncbi:hypothetical protein [Kitasatospora sp. NPDC085879]|uniref:hypothetical protein n=1 Tax=Kitasatospora sp. NPDC085879 TaxID=3154769 RepID=UPI00341DECBE